MLINISKIAAGTKLLFVAFRNYKKQFITVTALGIISGFFESIGVAAVIPLFYLMTGSAQPSIDIVSRTIQKIFSTIHIPLSPPAILIFILLLFCAKAAIYIIARYVSAKVANCYEENMRRDLFSRTMHASWNFILNQKGGYLESIILYDVERATSMISLISGLILLLTTFITYSLVAFSISAKITLLTIVIGVLIFLVYKPIFYRIRKLFQEIAKLQKDSNHHVSESMSGAKTIKSAAVVDMVINKANEYFARVRQVKLNTAMYRQSTINLIEPVGFIVIALLFVTTYHTPSFSIVAFAVIMFLIQRMFGYLQAAQSQLHSINEAIPYLQTILNYRQAVAGNKEAKSGNRPFVLENGIDFKGVKFSYGNKYGVLDSLNFHINKGEVVGIIGASGAGKTTITDLLLRLFDPQEGEITVDGVNISEIDIDKWRRGIGYVPQDVFLFNDTIKNNIRFFDDRISRDDIISATRLANILNLIQSLPEKFETVVGERGVRLSGGQRQRIALARALVRKPHLLILDEATSAIDTESEKLIQQSIQDLRGRVTVVIIAHRPSTIMLADNLLVLADGKIVETGVPKELLKNKNSYFSKINRS